MGMFSVEELGREIAVLAVHIDAATHGCSNASATSMRRLVGPSRGQRRVPTGWRGVGWDPATAREKVRVARALGKLPVIDQALKDGKLSYAKARALTRIAKPETEGELGLRCLTHWPHSSNGCAAATCAMAGVSRPRPRFQVSRSVRRVPWRTTACRSSAPGRSRAACRRPRHPHLLTRGRGSQPTRHASQWAHDVAPCSAQPNASSKWPDAFEQPVCGRIDVHRQNRYLPTQSSTENMPIS